MAPRAHPDPVPGSKIGCHSEHTWWPRLLTCACNLRQPWTYQSVKKIPPQWSKPNWKFGGILITQSSSVIRGSKTMFASQCLSDWVPAIRDSAWCQRLSEAMLSGHEGWAVLRWVQAGWAQTALWRPAPSVGTAGPVNRSGPPANQRGQRSPENPRTGILSNWWAKSISFTLFTPVSELGSASG